MRILVPTIVLAFAAVSCNNDNGVESDKPEAVPGKVVKPEKLNNQYACDGVIYDIKSVVYTEEEIDGATVLYFSSKSGITDITGMINSGEYMRVVAENNSGSNADFAGTKNEVSYKEVSVTSANCHNYTISSMFFDLATPTTADFSMEIAANDGKKAISASYYGYASRWPAIDLAEEAVAICTEVAQAVYFGQGAGTNAHEYDIIVATGQLTTTTDGSLVLVDKEGYAMHIGFMAIPNSAYKTRLPNGNYRNSSNSEAGTYLSVSYIGEFSTENGHQTMTSRPFDGDITVVTDDDNITTISAYFVDESGRRRMIAFRGNIGNFLDYYNSTSTFLPQFTDDVQFEADACDAAYYGRMGEQAYGSFEFTLYQNEYLEGDDDFYGATLLLTSETLFPSLESLNSQIDKLYGTYEVANTFTIPGTWFKPVEMNVYGSIQPYGTFVHKHDGSYYGLFGYGESGTITVSEGTDGGLRIEFDLVSVTGATMKGSYDGPIDWIWSPVTSSSDDGTSTLTEDYDMDLERYDSAILYLAPRLYIEGIGFIDRDKYTEKYPDNIPIGYQTIVFGNLGANNNPDGSVNVGDFLALELVTAPGEERQLKAGHYTISEHRWPAYFHPMENGEGVAIRGMMINGESYTSHWEHHKESSSGHLSEMDGHAFFYGGEVTITGPDEKGHYTFDVDCICVREHHVRGQWTGPVAGLEAPEETSSTKSWHAPMLLQKSGISLGRNITGETARKMEIESAKSTNAAPAIVRLH